MSGPNFRGLLYRPEEDKDLNNQAHGLTWASGIDYNGGVKIETECVHYVWQHKMYWWPHLPFVYPSSFRVVSASGLLLISGLFYHFLFALSVLLMLV